ncbi:hypothetical protein HJG60_010690 [Phyllostomus discolor]|uniref:Uncharacterized protein n=1 Tax=Phyllostomus discolor TaxID=89673 RepID=A0A834EFB6_9CHIR|nr:hypothetical protein HJG60_010690 [Phyllostomus discolor]
MTGFWSPPQSGCFSLTLNPTTACPSVHHPHSLLVPSLPLIGTLQAPLDHAIFSSCEKRTPVTDKVKSGGGRRWSPSPLNVLWCTRSGSHITALVLSELLENSSSHLPPRSHLTSAHFSYLQSAQTVLPRPSVSMHTPSASWAPLPALRHLHVSLQGPSPIPRTPVGWVMGSSLGPGTLVSFTPSERMGVRNDLSVPSPASPPFLPRSDSHVSDHLALTALASSPLPHPTAHPSLWRQHALRGCSLLISTLTPYPPPYLQSLLPQLCPPQARQSEESEAEANAVVDTPRWDGSGPLPRPPFPHPFPPPPWDGMAGNPAPTALSWVNKRKGMRQVCLAAPAYPSSLGTLTCLPACLPVRLSLGGWGEKPCIPERQRS